MVRIRQEVKRERGKGKTERKENSQRLTLQKNSPLQLDLLIQTLRSTPG